MDEIDYGAVIERSELYDKIILETYDAIEASHKSGEYGSYVIECFWCMGEGSEGLSRDVPPSRYVCQLCKGSGAISITPA